MMRAAFFGCTLTAFLAVGLGAQSAPPQAPAADALRPLNLPELSTSPTKPTAKFDIAAFFPENPGPSLATALSNETRTSAQLEALLTAYVGTWRGESTWRSLFSD